MTDFTPFDTPSTSTSSSGTGALPRSQGVTSFKYTLGDANSPTHDNMDDVSTMETSTKPHSLSHKSSSPHPTTTTLTDSPALSTGDGSPWIGGTGLGTSGLGKSGKVIERLMAECDRLKRDLRSEVAKREELQRATQTHRERLEALHAENCRLSNAKTMDDSMIKRRDRKIDELKAELQVEKQKRESLESRVQDAERKQQEQEQENHEQMQRFKEEAKQASTTATIYQTSHKQLREEYQQRIATAHRSLKELYDKRDEDRREWETDRRKMVKIDVVNQQMSQELEKTRRAHNDLMLSADRDREERAAVIEHLLKEAEQLRETDRRRELDLQKKMAEMLETTNRMKWVMAVKKNTEENGLHSPPPSPG